MPDAPEIKPVTADYLASELIACFDVGFEGSPVEEDYDAVVEERAERSRTVSVAARLFEISVKEIK